MKNHNLAKNIAVVCVSIIIGTIVFELCGHFLINFLEKNRPSGAFAVELLDHKDPVLGYALRKNLDLSFPGWSVRTDGLGFRGYDELSISKKDDEYRVFIVGGSTVFGWAVDGGETIPYFIQKLVDDFLVKQGGESGKKVKIINAGVPWYASWNEAAIIFFRILPLKPDAIFVVNGLNDTARAVSPTWSPMHMGYVDTPSRIVHEKRYGSQFNALLGQIINISPTLRYLTSKLSIRKLMHKGVCHTEAWTQYSQYMDWINRLTKSLGIEFAVFFQPVMVVKRTPLPAELERNATAMKSVEFGNTFRNQYLAGEQVLLKQRAFRFHSLSDAFEKFPELVYIDGQHYSPKANKRLAEIIFRREVSPLLRRIAGG